MLNSRLLLPFLLIATPALAAEMPRVNLETLERTHPGWTLVEQTGDPNSGTLVVERMVWPMFYLHWFPIEKTSGRLSAGKASEIVAHLWEGLTVDAPLKAAAVSLPAHEGFQIETTTSHGEMKNRYFVWACPQSGRVFVADTILNTTVNAPQILLDWQRDMARTVRCHPDAPVDDFPHLARRYDVPDGAVSYAMPFLWAPIAGYRIQKTFGGFDFAATHPAVTAKEGQDLAIASDAWLRLYVTWRPAPADFPMTFDELKQVTEDFWRARAANIMLQDTKATNDIWVVNGLERPTPGGSSMPPARMHKFRGWLWRKEGRLYFGVATSAGIVFGRRFPTQTLETWDHVLEGMFQAIVH